MQVRPVSVMHFSGETDTTFDGFRVFNPQYRPAEFRQAETLNTRGGCREKFMGRGDDMPFDTL